ncbi:MAG: NAD(P)H dehydrogenase (quinone) [Chroococcidiopsis cubana SAG 39.79]|nr:NAD(P)H dehydrogenase (quinone) [Chroococcidiopsis cubana SAG 39.79]
MKILVVYYSMYGHTLKLAQAVAEGASKIPGAEVMLRRVQEFEAVDQIIDQDATSRSGI